MPSKPCYSWFQVFETIINKKKPITYSKFNQNGYMIGHTELHKKLSDILVTNKTHNTFIEPDTLNKISKYNYTVKQTVIAYYLREKGIMNCEKNFHHKVTSLQEYMKFAELDLIQSFIKNLCKNYNKHPNSAECNLEFIYETIENICNHSNSYHLTNNEIFFITCENIKDYLANYEAQKNLGMNIYHENIIA